MAKVDTKGLFSAGLGARGRAAAWIVAFAGAVGADAACFLRILNEMRWILTYCIFQMMLQGLWYYMENRDNGQTFSTADTKDWNEKKKKAMSDKDKPTST